MKHLPKKIIVLLCVAVFGVHLAADMTAAAFSCNGKSCCCKKRTQAVLHVSKFPDYSMESGLCSVAASIRCCMRNEMWSDSKTIMVLTPKQNLMDGHGIAQFDIKSPSFLQPDPEPGGLIRFLTKNKTIPIYLKNLMLIC